MVAIRVRTKTNWISRIAFIILLYFLVGMLTSCAKNPGFSTLNGLESNLAAGEDSASHIPDEPSKEPVGNDNTPFTPNYKPDPLTWEMGTRPERVAWSNAVYGYISENFQVLKTAKDIKTFCENLDKEVKVIDHYGGGSGLLKNEVYALFPNLQP